MIFRRLAILGWCLLCACSDAGNDSDSLAGDAGARSDADVDLDEQPVPSEVAPRCEDSVDPNVGSSCAIVNDSCVTATNECCRCVNTHSCDYPRQWLCVHEHPLCPDEPPALGTPCEVGQGGTCVWCSVPAMQLTCADGVWRDVKPELYCAAQ